MILQVAPAAQIAPAESGGSPDQSRQLETPVAGWCWFQFHADLELANERKERHRLGVEFLAKPVEKAEMDQNLGSLEFHCSKYGRILLDGIEYDDEKAC